ncbi:MAG: ASKHA domain-containing protein [Ruminococcus sp.]|jgi:uncharacterized 2Fe-2S/4Fe-4S cluster protein (DUF4445 family)
MKLKFGSREVICKQGDTVLQCARKNQIPIDADCGGKEKCAKCKIKIRNGTFTSPGHTEKVLLTYEELKENIRLACCTRPLSDASIDILGGGKIKKGMLRNGCMPAQDCGIRKFHVEISEPSLDDQSSDVDRLEQAMNRNSYPAVQGFSLTAVRSLGEILETRRDVTVTMNGNRVTDISAGDRTGEMYGIAFDVGTTSVAGMLWDLSKGILLKSEAAANPQSSYGADVISRIQFCKESPENITILQQTIIQSLNQLILQLAEDCSVKPGDISKCTVVGNTAMSHLLLHVNPGRIARSPFAPVFARSLTFPAKEIGFCIHPEAEVCLLPNIGGHVGSDISAGILASGLYEAEDTVLFIDIGTNGEIVLVSKGRMYVCSTAAGPAFEGAGILHGMRAGTGAIEKVKIKNGRVMLSVVGETIPAGICGSGLIDAAAQLLETGLIDRKGRLMTREKALAAHQPPSIAARLRKREHGNEFVLAFGENGGKDIVLTQKDIREIQLAKGAVCAGIKMLQREISGEREKIDRFLVAGAFGSHIDVKSAATIRLFPDFEPDKIRFIGNAAGDGAGMALLSTEKRKLMERFVRDIRHIELATDPEFQTVFLESMAF